MARIKWVEDKTENYRGNYNLKCFKVNNSKYTFAFNAYMTYKTFKHLVKEFAQRYNSKIIEVLEDYGQSNMTVCSKFDNNTEKYDFTFRVELAVNEGEKRKFEYFEQSEIF